jgi:DNA/RNA endonuclease G (NUC1)
VRPSTLIRAAASILAVALLSCDHGQPLEPLPLFNGPRAADGAGIPSVVISQVYGAGGNSGALLRNDYVELFNRGDTPATLNGWSIQYGSATGTGNFGGNPVVTLSGTLAPGQYYLVQLSGGSNGSPLPTPDLTGTISMAAGAGKVVLASTTTGLACNGSSTPCSAAQLAQIVDLVGYGNANFFEGTGPAPTISAATAALRAGDGCQDTNDNSADFSAVTPAPRNTASPTHACVTTPMVVVSQVYGGGGNSGATLKNDFIELLNIGAQPVSLDGWSVQYASATGSFAYATTLSGTIQPGAYYLVQEAAGSGGTVSLPAPDATGSIAMSATSAKVILARVDTTLKCGATTAPCSAEQLALIADLVGYGSPNLYEGTGAAPTLSNSTAALRKGGGCQDTNDNKADFDAGAPAPRNSASAAHSCQGGPPVRLAISPDSASVSIEATQAFTAEAKDADSIVVYPRLTWTVADASIATVTAGGVVTGVALGRTTVTAQTDNGLTATAVVLVVPKAIHWIDVSSSADSFPPGFQTQLFATARTGSGAEVVPATFTFEALDPDIATVALVENTGIVTGVAASATRPRIRITATPLDGLTPPYQFTTQSLKIVAGVSAPVSIYGTNDEFGDPTAASESDPNDLLIGRSQYTISYNESRGTPNWVSYELDSRQFGSQDRCNCFTADPQLPADKQILTSDYTNGGYDRGHMTMSADRTVANLDNAVTFYLTNIVPQTADLNQGPWGAFENALNDSARAGRAVYVIDGPLYSRSHGLTFLKNEGKVAIPDSTWKVVFIGPVDGGLPFGRGDIQAWSDLPGVTLLAVSMPNVAGIRNVPWQTYLTTVDRIETATGYDFLSLLQTAFQTALEAGDHGPTAAFTYGGTLLPASPLAFDASASTDPDLGRTDMDGTEALTWAWTFGDGSTATGVAPVKAYAHGGTYTVTLTVMDAWGWPSTVSHTVTVLTPLQGIAVLAGQIAPLGASGGPLNRGQLNSLDAKLTAAAAACTRGITNACANQVGAFVNELQALVRSGRVDAATAAPIIDYAERVIASVRG